jgi:hypothetical protein
VPTEMMPGSCNITPDTGRRFRLSSSQPDLPPVSAADRLGDPRDFHEGNDRASRVRLSTADHLGCFGSVSGGPCSRRTRTLRKESRQDQHALVTAC